MSLFIPNLAPCSMVRGARSLQSDDFSIPSKLVPARRRTSRSWTDGFSQPSADGALNEEVVLCSHFVHGAACGARPGLPGSCGGEQAIGSVLLVDLGRRGGGP